MNATRDLATDLATRAESAERDVTAARQYLATAATAPNHTGTDLAGSRAARTAKRTDDPAEIMEVLAEDLLVGADDTWSGRRNDAARADFDGFRKGYREVRLALYS